jgi:PKD repeat protein
MTGSDTATLTVEPGNQAPVAAFDTSVTNAAPNQSIGFDPAASSDDDGILFYRWDFENDGTFDQTTTSPIEVQHAYSQFGSYTALLRVEDMFGATSSITHTVSVDQGNRAPVADAGGPYVLTSGEVLVLNATLSSDPDAALGDAIASYAWDLDNDGQYDDASGATSIVPPFTLQALGLTPGATYTIGVEVTDSFGASASDTASLFIARPLPGTLPGDPGPDNSFIP